MQKSRTQTLTHTDSSLMGIVVVRTGIGQHFAGRVILPNCGRRTNRD